MVAAFQLTIIHRSIDAWHVVALHTATLSSAVTRSEMLIYSPDPVVHVPSLQQDLRQQGVGGAVKKLPANVCLSAGSKMAAFAFAGLTSDRTVEF